jgi:hypothetical protein
MKASVKKIRELLRRSIPIAEQQTKLRNGKEALLERGQWMEMDAMLAIKAAVDEEGWARMKSLKARIDCIGLTKMFSVRSLLLSYIPSYNIYLLE